MSKIITAVAGCKINPNANNFEKDNMADENCSACVLATEMCCRGRNARALDEDVPLLKYAQEHTTEMFMDGDKVCKKYDAELPEKHNSPSGIIEWLEAILSVGGRYILSYRTLIADHVVNIERDEKSITLVDSQYGTRAMDTDATKFFLKNEVNFDASVNGKYFSPVRILRVDNKELNPKFRVLLKKNPLLFVGGKKGDNCEYIRLH